MKRKQVATAALCLVFAQTLSASWISDITGVNIDVPSGKVEFGAPKPSAIGDMLNELPHDIGVTLLGNAIGNAMAFEVRRAEAAQYNSAKRMPEHIKRALAPYFPARILDAVRWENFDPAKFTLPNSIIKARYDAVGAVTMNRLVIFNQGAQPVGGPSRADTDCALWAHELTHVLQYDQMGIEAFAAIYCTGVGADKLEQQAYDWQEHVTVAAGLDRATGGCPPVVGNPGPWKPPTKFFHAYAKNYQGGSRRLSYKTHFVPRIRSAYPPEGCAKERGSAADHTVSITNQCNIPIRIAGWRQGDDEKTQKYFTCNACKLAASETKTFTTPSKKPLISVDYRYYPPQ